MVLLSPDALPHFLQIGSFFPWFLLVFTSTKSSAIQSDQLCGLFVHICLTVLSGMVLIYKYIYKYFLYVCKYFLYIFFWIFFNVLASKRACEPLGKKDTSTLTRSLDQIHISVSLNDRKQRNKGNIQNQKVLLQV